MRKLLISAAAVLLAWPAAAKPVPCTNAAGFVIDPDPKGVNVRAAPSIRARRIAVIPKRTRGTLVDVAASDKGWLLITKAEDSEGQVTFKGRGWVHGSRLGVALQRRAEKGTPLYAAPRKDARVIRWFPGPGDNYTARIVSCARGWTRVRLKGATGWLASDNRCPLPWTTCP